MIPNAGQYSPTWYSEKNDKSAFRFVRMTEHEGTGFTVEHKCSICGSVQIEGGFSIDLNNSAPYIVCKSCHENDQWVGFCSLCDLETPDCGPNGLIEYPNHWDAPPQMNHYHVICGPCWDSPETHGNDPFNINYVQEDDTMNPNPNNDDTVSNELPLFDFPKDPEAAATEKRLDEALQKLEDKVDALQDYLQGRDALFRDHRDGEITMEEVEAALTRLKNRLK